MERVTTESIIRRPHPLSEAEKGPGGEVWFVHLSRDRVLHGANQSELDGRHREIDGAFHESQFHFGEHFSSHGIAGGIVEPVQEPPAGRWFTEAFIRLETALGEEFFDFADGVQAFAQPSAIAEGTTGLDGPILDTHQRRW